MPAPAEQRFRIAPRRTVMGMSGGGMNICGSVVRVETGPNSGLDPEANAGLLAVAAALSGARTRREAFDALARFVEDLGLPDLMLTVEAGGLSEHGPVRWTTLDWERAERLDQIGFDGHDPIRRFARRCVDPFIWSRSDWPGVKSPAAGDIMLGLKKAGIEAGISLAVWGRGGRVAIADAFGSWDQVRAVPPAARDTLFIAVALAFRCIERLSLVRSGPMLTRREQEILELAAQGLTSRAIAQRLEIVEPTVKFHFKGIREKLNARNKSEAIARFSALDAATYWTKSARDDQGAPDDD